MSTMTLNPAFVKSSRTVRVAGELFEACPEVPPCESITSWRLTSLDGSSSALVLQTSGGSVFCTCRCMETNDPGECVHSAALTDAGLLQPVLPVLPVLSVPCPECGQTHDQADPADWPSWTDEDLWTLSEASESPYEPREAIASDEPSESRLTLEEALEAIQAGYAAIDSDLGDLLAHTIGELVSEVRLTGARDVATLLDRRACLGS